MFDFSFGELVVVGAVALVVIGPERLPAVARTVGAMVGRFQRYVAGVKEDIRREVEFDNLKRLEAEMHEAGRQISADIHGHLDPMHDDLHAAANEVKTALTEPATQTASVAAEADKQFDLFAGEPIVAAPQTITRERDRR